MSIPGWLTDRIILEPTRHKIHAPGARRELLAFAGGHLEVWIHRIGPCDAVDPELYVLKFPGTASRAENSTGLVQNCWLDSCVEVWAVNPPGYGGSSGTASLKNIPTMASCALDALQGVAKGNPVVVAGGSLGSVSAIYLAANYSVDGLLVQNPPALRQVIKGRADWWHFSWATRMIANQVPEVLDSIENSTRIKVPAVFVVAGKDRIVPAMFQQQIIDAYAAPKQILFRPEADHDTPLSEHDLQQLGPLAAWLRDGMARQVKH